MRHRTLRSTESLSHYTTARTSRRADLSRRKESNPNRIADYSYKSAGKFPTLTLIRLETLGRDWLLDCEARFCSKATLDIRKTCLRNLAWFVRHRYEVPDSKQSLAWGDPKRDNVIIGTHCMRSFLVYLRNDDPLGKWGAKYPNGKSRFTKGLKAKSVETYDNHLRSCFKWLEVQEEIELSPMAKIEPTVVRSDHLPIFTQEQTVALFRAASRTITKRRDVAMLRFMLDTGCRVSELCNIKVRDVNFDERRVTLIGKGNKKRQVGFGRRTSRWLYIYLADGQRRGDAIPPSDDEPLFRSIKGRIPGSAMTRRGVLDAVASIGKAAGIEDVRCSTHTFRHTCATNLLERGVPMTVVRDILGHTDIRQTEVYAHIAEAKVTEIHRDHSVVDALDC